MSLQSALQDALKLKQKSPSSSPAPPPPPPPKIIEKKDNKSNKRDDTSAPIIPPGPSLKDKLASRAGQKKKEYDDEHKSKPVYPTNILACGNGKYGRLAQGVGNASSLPKFTFCKSIEQNLFFSKLSCGAGHILALTPQNIVYSWGKCHFGQLGHGEENVDVHLPKPVKGLLEGKKVMDVSCGWSFSFAVGEHGELYAWGCGYYGALGIDVEQSHYSPIVVPFFSLEEISKDSGRQVVKVAGGSYHSAVLTKSKNVFSFGRNLSGQLGLGDTRQRVSPSLISSFVLSDLSPSLSPLCFKNISCGDQHTAMIDEDGKLYIAGDGQLVPKIEENLENKKLEFVVNGIHRTLVCDDEGQIYEQRLPEKQFVHLPLGEGLKVSAIGRGETHSMCVTTCGKLFTWGDNYCCKLGYFGGNFKPKQVDLSVAVSFADGGSNQSFVW